MIKKAGPLTGKTEMAAEVAQVVCAIFLKRRYGWDLPLYYCSYKYDILGHGRALWAAHVHQISALYLHNSRSYSRFCMQLHK